MTLSFDPRDRGLDSRVKDGTSFWSPYGEFVLSEGLLRANRTHIASAQAIGLPTWEEVADHRFVRPKAPPLLPAGISIDEARVAFGELYPITTRDSHLLTDPIGVPIHLTHVTLAHLTTASAKLHEQRYRLIPLIRGSIERPTEIWEVWHHEQGGSTRARRRLYLTLFDELKEFPDGILSIATHTPVRGGGYRFTHLTLYSLDEERSLDRIEEKRRGRLVYVAYDLARGS